MNVPCDHTGHTFQDKDTDKYKVIVHDTDMYQVIVQDTACDR
jgi:hypothetical protein